MFHLSYQRQSKQARSYVEMCHVLLVWDMEIFSGWPRRNGLSDERQGEDCHMEVTSKPRPLGMQHSTQHDFPGGMLLEVCDFDKGLPPLVKGMMLHVTL